MATSNSADAGRVAQKAVRLFLAKIDFAFQATKSILYRDAASRPKGYFPFTLLSPNFVNVPHCTPTEK